MTTTLYNDVSAYPVLEFKGENGSGLFAALVSAFGNKDLNGDRVMPGAFTSTIERWQAKNKPIPVVWSHGHDNLGDFIGEVDPQDIRETKDGLVVAGKFFVDDSEQAANVFSLMKRGLITAWSFAFAPRDEGIGEDGTREIRDLELFEVGPTLIGANPEAQTIALKALGTRKTTPTEDKRGRSISAANAVKLRQIKELISSLLVDDEEPPAPLTEAEKVQLELNSAAAMLSKEGIR